MVGSIFVLARSNDFAAALARNDVCPFELSSLDFAIYWNSYGRFCVYACQMLIYAALVNINYTLFGYLFDFSLVFGAFYLTTFGVSITLFFIVILCFLLHFPIACAVHPNSFAAS